MWTRRATVRVGGHLRLVADSRLRGHVVSRIYGSRGRGLPRSHPQGTHGLSPAEFPRSAIRCSQVSEFLTALVASLTSWTPPLTTPCFPDQPVLRASTIYKDLEKFSWSLYDTSSGPPERGTFGTCTVEGGRVSAADGTLVAEIGCGVHILAPRIVDDLGLQIGATGKDVLARKPRPQQPLSCFPNGPTQTRCQFDRPPNSDTDGTMYIVEGVLDEPITGAKARTYFAPRTIVEIHTSVWCH